MTDKKAEKDTGKFVDEDFDNINSVVSTTDMTGLMQTPPESEAEMESFTEIYDIPKSGSDSDKK